MADDLASGAIERLLALPPHIARRREVRDSVVKAPQPAGRCRERVVARLIALRIERLPGQVAQHLALLIVDPVDDGDAVEAALAEEPQKLVHGRSPGARWPVNAGLAAAVAHAPDSPGSAWQVCSLCSTLRA